MLIGSVIEPIKALHEAADDLTSQDLDRLFDDQISTGVIELAVLEARVMALKLRLVAEAGRRQLPVADGYSSAASWMADRCRLSYGLASLQLGLAHSLEQMPLTEAAFVAGDIDVVRVRRLATAHNVNAELFRRDETMLVESAVSLTPRHLATAIDYWRQNADRRRFDEDADAMHEQRRLHISNTFSGMVRLDADLDPESGRIVATAIRSLTEPAARDGDGRTAAQSRHDALVDVCGFWLDHGRLPVHGGSRPHLSVLIDHSSLTGSTGGRSEFDDGTVITPETARRLACDAAISRIVTDGPSEVLDVGRTTRVVPAPIRRALDIRDRGCTWPGCDRPPRLCDAHHITHWADGGPTTVTNLRLLCRTHHRLTHTNRDPDRPP